MKEFFSLSVLESARLITTAARPQAGESNSSDFCHISTWAGSGKARRVIVCGEAGQWEDKIVSVRKRNGRLK